MTCGQCKYCVPQNACDCDCECAAKSDGDISFQVSQDDDIRFYGESTDSLCKLFAAAG